MTHTERTDRADHEIESQQAGSSRWLTLTVLCLIQFILIIDITVVQIALPTIDADLSLGRDALTWVISTYTVCFGGLMVLGGRLADARGARRLLLVGLAIFTAASLLCGLSQNAALLLTGRAAQGVGAAVVSPAALSIIVRTFRGAERNRALAVWGTLGAAGIAVGVVLSGALTGGPGWRWVFFINVPIGVLVFAAVPFIVRRDRSRAQQPVDVPGGLIVTLATGLLVYGLIAAGDSGWATPRTLVPIAVALLLYLGFVSIENRVRVPLMRIETLTRRPVVAGTSVIMIATVLTISMFFLSSLYLQQTRSFTPLRTGLLFLPVAIATAAGAHLGAQLIARLGARTVAVLSFVVAAAGAALMMQVAVDGNPYRQLLPGFLLASFGIGPAFVAATSTALGNVPADEAGVASGIVNTFHELGGGVGVAVMSTVAAASISSPSPTAEGYQQAFLLCAVLAAVAAALALMLVPSGAPSNATAGHGHGHGH